jgi:WD40 repeat protein/predicted ATPase/transcriptional regulator with XRE-family HTH domain
MKRFSYRDRDYSFGQAMLTLRSNMSITQTELADLLGVSRRAVGAWEAGSKYPNAEHLKKFIVLAIAHRAFPPGNEAEEVRALWQAARQKVLLSEKWLADLLAPANQPSAPPIITHRVEVKQPTREAETAARSFPSQSTPFIGRQPELSEIGRILDDPTCRLLTLLGPGGIGKTRLGIEIAQEQAQGFQNGVAFVPLAPISAPSQIVPAMGEALNLSFQGQTDPKDQLLDYLRRRHMLLVMDNFEHVLDGTDVVYDILQRAPQVTILATSRVRLNLQAEWLFDVDGLTYPPGEGTSDLSAYSAVELFVQRARQVQPRFPVTASILRSIVSICQQVAGMPLAIELAAAGVRTLSVEEIDGQIRANLDGLTTSLRDVQPRHRSMRAVFDHSWDLLTEPERVLFTRMAVFRGGCTIEAVEQVTGANLPALLTMVDKSLVRQVNTKPRSSGLVEPRYFLLEPIREYAWEKLTASGEMATVQQAHAMYYLALSDGVMANWNTPTIDPASEQINRDLNNIRAALGWTSDSGHTTIGLELAGVLWRFWRSGGYSNEGRGWLEELMARDEPGNDPAALSARLLGMHAAAWLASDQHDYNRAKQLFEQTVTLRRTLGGTEADTHLLHNSALEARAVGDYRQATLLLEEALTRNRELSTGGLGQSLYEMGFSLYGLALMLREQGDYEPAIALYEESLQFHQEIGDRESMAQALLGLGDVARDRGNTIQTRAYTDQSLAIYREFGTQWAIGFALNNLAQAAYLDGDLAQAHIYISESVSLFRGIQNEGGLTEALITLGYILAAQGDTKAAQHSLTEALRLARVIGPRLLLTAAIEGLAVTMVEIDQCGLAAQLMGAAAVLRQAMGTPVRPADRPILERAIASARVALGSEDFEMLWSEAGDEPLEYIVTMIPGVIADDEAPHSEVPLDPPTLQPVVEQQEVIPNPSAPANRWRVDWDNAVRVSTFFGREWELNLLSEWVIEERCRVITVLGLGGIGKSALAVTLMHRLAEQFAIVIWRSLRDIATCEVLLDELLQVLGHQTVNQDTASFDRRLGTLMETMRSSRILLVLDNLESVMEEGENAGQLLPGYAGFRQFLRKSAETEHQSCVILTSREKPADLVPLEGSHAPVRALRLARLDTESSEKLLADKGVGGSSADRARLIEAYTGNPLALKIVSQTIVDLFDGDIAPFLEQGEVIFGGIRELLNQQFARLPRLQQSVLLWLAILREPLTLPELQSVMVTAVQRGRLLEAVESLHRASLIERGKQQGNFTLQSVVLEYMTARIITEASEEIQSGNLSRITIEHGFELAQAHEYVREIQQRLIVTPILENLRSSYPQQSMLEAQLRGLFTKLATWDYPAQGYASANLVTLLRALRGNLRGVNLSGLALRNLYLQGIELQDASIAETLVQGTVFTETFDAVTAVATNHTGDYWATGSRRGEVQLWAAGGLTLQRAWRAHADIICAMRFSPDGRSLATTGSWDGTLKLWDITSGALLWSAKHASQAYNLAFSPDGKIIASSGYDAVVRLWDRGSGAQLRVLEHAHSVLGIAWSPDGRLLATGDLNGSIRVWDMGAVEASNPIATLDGHSNCVEGLEFSPDGSTLASGSWDATVRLWDVASGQTRHTLTEFTDRVICVAWSPDGRVLASAGRNQIIWLWDAEQQNYQATLHGHTGGVYGIAFTPDNRSLISGSEDSTLRVWDIGSARCTRFLQGYAASLYDVDWSPDGQQLVSGCSDALVTSYSLTGARPPRVLQGHLGFVIGVGWNANGRWLASTEWNNMIRVWDVHSGEAFQILRYPDKGDYLDRLAWSPDGRQLASGTYSRGLQLFEMTTQNQQWKARYLTSPTWIRHVAWRIDSLLVAGGGADGIVYIWDANDGRLVQELKEHYSSVIDIAWSPDGRRMVSSSRGQEDGELFVWDAARGEILQTFGGHPGIAYAVVWDTNDEIIISGDAYGTLRWWDVGSGECVLEREGHQGTIHTLRRSPDGTTLASCGADGAVMLWDMRTGDHLQTLRRDRPYERLNITGIKGLTDAQKATLRTLGAVEE